MPGNECGALIKKINTIQEHRVNQNLSEMNLTLSQWRYLDYMYSRGGSGILMKDFEEYFNVTQPTVAGIVKRLAAKDLIYLEKFQEDPHYKTANLTEKGERVYRESSKRKKSIDDVLLGPLDSEEKAEFQRLLIKVYDGNREA